MSRRSDLATDRPHKIPLVVKVLYTAFVAVLVPKYLHDYGPTNFLYFCDIALLLAVPALWLESSLLTSLPAVGISVMQTAWALDFLANCVGLRLIGFTDYMFDAKIPWFTRFLSSFHLWLPWLLLWMVARLGYDRRALPIWTALAWVVFFVSYFLMPPPPAPSHNPNLPVNLNYVYGFGNEPQTWLPQPVFFGLGITLVPIVFFLPAHFLLARFWGKERAAY